MFWQTWDPDTVYTWERVPPGFFSMYYGLDSDRFCAIANAMRAGWICYTFGQARAELGNSPDSKDAEKIWNNFNMYDGICILQGFGGRRSLLTMAVTGNAERLLRQYHVVFSAAAARLDELLAADLDSLFRAPRARGLLSPAEEATVQAQIDHPHLTVRQQASLLNVSVRTLEKRHADIAKKLGVSSFPGAIVIALDHGRIGASTSESGDENSKLGKTN
jgi:DNA-binding CsgD family transcriptional regulator